MGLERDIARAALRLSKGIAEIALPRAPEIGVTPRALVSRNGARELWHYPRRSGRRGPAPVFLVHSLVSKPYIYDIRPGLSLIEFLTGHGHDVYLLDWGAPTALDRRLTLDDYVGRFLPIAIEEARRHAGSERVALYGYCFGGTMALIACSQAEPLPVSAVALVATPVTFSKIGFAERWSSRHLDIDLTVETLGVIPADMMRATFRSLRPASEIGRIYGILSKVDDDRYMETFRAFDRWAVDHVPLAGGVLRQLVKELLWEDALPNGTLCIRGLPVDLKRMRFPLLNCLGQHDTMVTPDSNAPLMQIVGSRRKEQLMLNAGHMSVVAGRDAARTLWPKLDGWLRKHA